jgi:hypothetical protein
MPLARRDLAVCEQMSVTHWALGYTAADRPGMENTIAHGRADAILASRPFSEGPEVDWKGSGTAASTLVSCSKRRLLSS